MSQDLHLVAEAIKNGAIPAGYIEVDVEFFQFANPGDILAGKLIEKTTQKIGNNMCGKYTLIDSDNQRVEFLGSTQLDSRLRLIAAGHNVVIYFDHTEKAKGDNRNDTKIYKVFVPETPKQ
jgi:hypothetical protein